MKKAAIVTLYDDMNLGNKLQNYAVQEICRGLGYEAESLVNPEVLWSPSFKARVVLALGFPKGLAQSRRMMLDRREHFRAFSKRHLTVAAPAMKTEADWRNLSAAYDVFLVGSDQVWHNWKNSKSELDYFFLRFAEEKKRVCISPSFGFEKLPEGFLAEYTEGLRGFRHLCCREESGCRMIEAATGRKAQRLCDPTMMLTKDRWQAFSKKPAYPVPDRYMLVYCLAKMSPASRALMARIAGERGLEILDVYNFNHPQQYMTTPDEFVYLVEHASYVFTDSFHACVFSILFHRDFTVSERADRDGARMHGRLDTLLAMFGLEGRAAYAQGDTGEIDYAAADGVIAGEREAAMDYLARALEDAAGD